MPMVKVPPNRRRADRRPFPYMSMCQEVTPNTTGDKGYRHFVLWSKMLHLLGGRLKLIKKVLNAFFVTLCLCGEFFS